MSFSSTSIDPGALRGTMPPHRRDAILSQTAFAARKAGSRARPPAGPACGSACAKPETRVFPNQPFEPRAGHAARAKPRIRVRFCPKSTP